MYSCLVFYFYLYFMWTESSHINTVDIEHQPINDNHDFSEKLQAARQTTQQVLRFTLMVHLPPTKRI